MQARADIEPRARNDDGVDERPFDPVVDRRLVALVDDADRHQQHPRAHVDAAGDQEIDVGLFQFDLSALLESFDEGMFELELTDKAAPVTWETDGAGQATRSGQTERPV